MDKYNKFWAILLGVFFLVKYSSAVPKYEGNSKTHDTDEKSRRSYYNENNNTQQLEQDTASTKDRLQRLGYTTGYGALNGYPTSNTGLYNPIKLDLGGVVLGTLVGIGAIIIIPKLLQAFHGGYTGYGRSEDNNDMMSISSMINKIDDILSQNNIDSTSCMQRAVCNYVQSTEYKMKRGSSDQLDEFVHMLSENSVVDYLLDGTAIKEAIDHGKNDNGRTCENLYTTCQYNSTTALNVLMKILPKRTSNITLPLNGSK